MQHKATILQLQVGRTERPVHFRLLTCIEYHNINSVIQNKNKKKSKKIPTVHHHHEKKKKIFLPFSYCERRKTKDQIRVFDLCLKIEISLKNQNHHHIATFSIRICLFIMQGDLIMSFF